MLDASHRFDRLPNKPGVGYKPQHFAEIMEDPGPVAWLEIHAENYMGAGGRPRAQLRALAERFAISVHGVGLSIGGMIAQGLAARRLDIVRAMVLSNTAAKIGTKEMWDGRIDGVKTGGIESLADGVMERWFSKQFLASPDLE